jgi:hypothetical protein
MKSNPGQVDEEEFDTAVADAQGGCGPPIGVFAV